MNVTKRGSRKRKKKRGTSWNETESVSFTQSPGAKDRRGGRGGESERQTGRDMNRGIEIRERNTGRQRGQRESWAERELGRERDRQGDGRREPGRERDRQGD